jgi:hypothetical protein
MFKNHLSLENTTHSPIHLYKYHTDLNIKVFLLQVSLDPLSPKNPVL